MAHQFTVRAQFTDISAAEFKRLVSNTDLHLNVCKRIPGENLEIIESTRAGDIYTLKRAYNLDVDIPDIAKKFLKDAFRLKRTDITHLEQMTSTVELAANLPLKATCQRSIETSEGKIQVILNWEVQVKVPLIGGMLERHAEGEIRKFSQVEIEIIQDELLKNKAA